MPQSVAPLILNDGVVFRCGWPTRIRLLVRWVIPSVKGTDSSGRGWLLGKRWNSSRILWSTPVQISGISGGGILEKSQHLFPLMPFWFPAGQHSAAEDFRTIGLVWFGSSSTPAGGQCPAKAVGILLLSLILHSLVQLAPSTMNSGALNIFL